jgi:hypothetical protein
MQVTKFRCGGVVVGCTFDHRVCDAYSFSMFLVAWAAAAGPVLPPRKPAPLCTAGALADRLFVPVSRTPREADTNHT